MSISFHLAQHDQVHLQDIRHFLVLHDPQGTHQFEADPAGSLTVEWDESVTIGIRAGELLGKPTRSHLVRRIDGLG